MVSSLGFIFTECIPGWILETPAAWTHQWLQTEKKKKDPRKNLLSLAKGLGKGQSSKTKTFKRLLLYFRQISQKKLWLHPHNLPQRPDGEPRLPLFPGYDESSQSPCWGSNREKQMESHDFHLCLVGKSPGPSNSRCQWRPCGKPGYSSTPKARHLPPCPVMSE